MDDFGKLVDEKMKKSLENTRRTFAQIRTGRASPALLDSLKVDYYGTLVPLKQLASISVPESRSLLIQPFDKNALADMEKAILKSDLGLNPRVEGGIIRLAIPQLTEERRRELMKLVKKSAEDGKVVLRNLRREALDNLKKGKAALSEDAVKFREEELDKLTHKYSEEIDKLLAAKEKEVMEV